MLVELKENNGTKYKLPGCFGDEYILPRCEFLLHQVKGKQAIQMIILCNMVTGQVTRLLMKILLLQ